MTKEQYYFLTIIKDYICGCKTEAKDVGWQTVYTFSQSHQLAAIVYHQCKKFIPVADIDSFKSVSLSTIYSNTNRKKITEEILSLLRKNDINCFLIKGFDIADFYPNWQYRTMGDTDIVVDDLEKAHDILLGVGYKNLSKIKDREYQYSKQNMEFELHDRLVYEEAINLDSTIEFLNDYKKYVIDGRLDDSFHFIFVLNHLRKHFMNSGVGFRQFVDIAVLIKNDNRIDWVWTEEKLDEIGLLPFAKIVFYYIERWFGVEAPIEAKTVSDDVYEASTRYVFDNGVFGFDNEENKDFLASNTVRKARYPKLIMMKSAIQKAFPGYHDLIRSEHYSFLIGKPILLPAAWIYRFGRVIKNKRFSEGRTQISKSFISKEYIAKREEMFRNWGLE